MEEKKRQPIDFVKIAKKLWPHRKKYYYILPATLIISYLLILSIPRYYKCTVSLAPETGISSLSGSLGSLASSFGLGSSMSKLNADDAIFAEIYPDVIHSKNFIVGLMDVPLSTQDGKIKCNYYTYLRDKQKAPWWDILKGKIVALFKSVPKDQFSGKGKLSVFNLTKKQNELFEAVQANIKCIVDKKTNVVAITVRDQDPKVCALMADATCQKLQEFIINYRTNKSRIDYEYYKKLCEDSKKTYEKALQLYAANADAHTHTILASYQAKIESMENDMQAKYNIYTAMNNQLQAATAKLQESTPAFTVIESASIPTKPAGPKRMLISIFMTILAFFVLSFVLLIREKNAIN